jgi:hypothetical protein
MILDWLVGCGRVDTRTTILETVSTTDLRHGDRCKKVVLVTVHYSGVARSGVARWRCDPLIVLVGRGDESVEVVVDVVVVVEFEACGAAITPC